MVVVIYIDEQLSKIHRDSKARQAYDMLCEAGATVYTVRRAHNKTLCVDDKILIEGSFNWLSASRNPNCPYQRQETSLCCQGEGVNEMIREAIGEMRKIILPTQPQNMSTVK